MRARARAIARDDNAIKRNLLYALLVLGVILVVLRVAAPYAVKAYVNQLGADEKGYTFKISDLDLKLLKGKAIVRDLVVFNKKTDVTYVRVNDLELDFDWSELFDDHKNYAATADRADITVSKDFIDEVNRVKNEAKERVPSMIYLDRVTAGIQRINLRELRNGSPRTIVSLRDADVVLRDFGLGSRNVKTSFDLKSKLVGGGSVVMTGKTRLQEKETPWVIDGSLRGITAGVIEKMAGDRLPLKVEQANFDADLVAWSNGGKIFGHILPKIKDVELKDDAEEGFIKRNVAKAANFIFDKAKPEDKPMSLKLPFSLKENLRIDVPGTVEMIQAQEE